MRSFAMIRGFLAGLTVVFGLGTASVTEASAATVAPEIVELARSLKNDPDLIHAYVYNNISTLPIYGSLKGPLGALIDGQGTAFDQAELMVQLLQQASLSNANISSPQFQFGQIQMSQAQLSAWLGIDNSVGACQYALGSGGFSGGCSTSGGVVNGAALSWAWVKVNIKGTAYQFDPAAKLSYGASYNWTTPQVNLATAMGYSQASFLSDATSGATVTATSATNINRAKVRADLTTYGTNLANWIKANQPAAGTAGIIGGKSINALPIGAVQRTTSLPWIYTATAVTSAATIPSQYRTTMQVSVPGGSNVTFNSSDIYGHRLTVFFNGSLQPVLALDGVTQTTGSAQKSGATVSLPVVITHPFSAGNQSGSLSIYAASSSAYLIGNGWGPVSRAMISRHHKLLAQNSAANPTGSSSEAVLGESLAVLGTTWLAETSQIQQNNDMIAGTMTGYLHGVGIVGVRPINASSTQTGPYVDLPLNAVMMIQRNKRPNSAAITPVEAAAFYVTSMTSSVLESGTLEQMQPGLTAVSTVKLMDQDSQNGDTIYDITSLTTYNASIRPILAKTYTAADLARIDTLVSKGTRVIAPAKGNMSVNSWTGTGYFQIASDNSSIGSIITGGMSGGFSTMWYANDNVDEGAEEEVEAESFSFAPSVPGSSMENNYNSYASVADPLNIVTGDYQYSHTDLTVGSGKFPYALSVSRDYSSAPGQAGQVEEMGLGWTHSFSYGAFSGSDGFQGMGVDSPVAGAASIAALYVAQDILNGQTAVSTPLPRIVAGSQTLRWMMDQLTGNAVTISQPGSSEIFVKLLDGSYLPPLTSQASLSQTSAGTYIYKASDGVALNFNSQGYLASWVSPAGPMVNFTYNSSGNLTQVANSMGRALSFSYNAQGLVSSISDGTRSVSYGYDSAKNLTSYTDPLGSKTLYTYGTAGQLISIFYPSQPGNAYVTNVYDSLGRVKQQKDASGNLTVSYFAGNRTEVVDPTGANHVYYLNIHGKTVAEVDAYGSQTSSVYDALGRLTQVTYPEGNFTSTVYDNSSPSHYQNALTVTSTPKTGYGQSPLVTKMVYDPKWNKPVSVTDPNGNVSTVTYDATLGLPVKAVAANGAVTSTAYNARGQVTTVTDPLGKVTSFTYSASNETLTSVIDDAAGLKLSTAYSYDAVGNALTATDPNGNVTTSAYDMLRRVTQVTAPAATGAVTKTVYDADSNVLSVSQATGNSSAPWQTVSWTYTPSFKVKTQTDPNGNVTTTAYDGADRPSMVTDPLGRVTKTVYDPLGRVSTVSNPAIQATPLEAYAYYANGKVGTFADANGKVTSYHYDGFIRPYSTVYPDGTAEYVLLDGNGNMLGKQFRDNSVMYWSYDVLNRVVQVSPKDMVTPLVQTAYDAAGHVTALTSYSPIGQVISSGSVSFVYGYSGQIINAYDTAGRQVSTTNAQGQKLSYSLDKNGNRTRLTWPDGYFIAYGYDALNRMTTVSENGTASLASYGWNALSKRSSVGFGNGASATYGYDSAFNDLTSLKESFVGSAVTLSYGYNKGHQITSVASTDAAFLSYPAASNSVSYTAGVMNQYTAVGGGSPSYDGRGNLTADGINTFAYDHFNRLITATTPQGITSYGYDGMGRRVSAMVSGVTTRTLMDGQRELGQYDGSGKLLSRYVYGPGLDEHIVTVAADGSKTWLHADLQNTVIADSGANGAVGSKYAYGPFGETRSMTGSNFRYTGRVLDANTGLYYYRARMYSPVLGRFMQVDPTGFNGGKNLYRYVNNDPLNQVDPMGTSAREVANENDILAEEEVAEEEMATASAGGNWNNNNNFPPSLALGGEEEEEGSGGRPDFYVNSLGTAIPGTGYRAVTGDDAVNEAQGGVIGSRNPTYITFSDISGMSASQAQSYLQLPMTPSGYVSFNTLQIVGDVSIPNGMWGKSNTPEPITSTYPGWGSGGATQAITYSSLKVDSYQGY